MPKGLLIALAAGLVVVVAVLEGKNSNRWGSSEDGLAAAARLERIPGEFGDWSSTEAPLDPKILKVAEAVGCVSRIYTNRKTGERIDVLLLSGPSGPIGAHTPDVCYGGLGYGICGREQRKSLTLETGQAVSLWDARFEKKATGDEPLRVLWAWGVDGDWEATANPRRDFALQGSLYKLYVVRREEPTDRTRARDSRSGPLDGFLLEFLPRVKTALSPGAGQS